MDAPGQPEVIGEIDLETAPVMVYEDAIYMHQARTYLVERLDWDGRIAYARPVEVDYYTRASIGSRYSAASGVIGAIEKPQKPPMIVVTP